MGPDVTPKRLPTRKALAAILAHILLPLLHVFLMMWYVMWIWLRKIEKEEKTRCLVYPTNYTARTKYIKHSFHDHLPKNGEIRKRELREREKEKGTKFRSPKFACFLTRRWWSEENQIGQRWQFHKYKIQPTKRGEDPLISVSLIECSKFKGHVHPWSDKSQIKLKENEKKKNTSNFEEIRLLHATTSSVA